MTNTGPQPLDGHAFAANAERNTNTAAIHEWTALYAPDATAEWVIDGARQHLVSRTAINAAITELATLWRNVCGDPVGRVARGSRLRCRAFVLKFNDVLLVHPEIRLSCRSTLALERLAELDGRGSG